MVFTVRTLSDKFYSVQIKNGDAFFPFSLYKNDETKIGKAITLGFKILSGLYQGRVTKDDYDKNKKVIIERAVTMAIDECIAENILRDFFIANRKEALVLYG